MTPAECVAEARRRAEARWAELTPAEIEATVAMRRRAAWVLHHAWVGWAPPGAHKMPGAVCPEGCTDAH